MEYVKAEKDGYILGVAKVGGKGNISEAEYNTLSEILSNMPTPPDNHSYRLTTGLEWELCENPVFDPSAEELTDSEALNILLGGVV